jgi:selenocysteine lyase/cysteine desulfurase
MLLRKIILRLVERKPTTGYFVLRGRFESKAIITSKIEHHAVLYTVQALQKNLVFR